MVGGQGRGPRLQPPSDPSHRAAIAQAGRREGRERGKKINKNRSTHSQASWPAAVHVCMQTSRCQFPLLWALSAFHSDDVIQSRSSTLLSSRQPGFLYGKRLRCSWNAEEESDDTRWTLVMACSRIQCLKTYQSPTPNHLCFSDWLISLFGSCKC